MLFHRSYNIPTIFCNAHVRDIDGDAIVRDIDGGAIVRDIDGGANRIVIELDGGMCLYVY